MHADTNSIIQTWIFGFQLIAYIVTIICLLASLKAQRVANNLTNQKFIYDIKPFFTLSHPFEFTARLGATPDTIEERYLIKLERNVAKDFHIEVISRDFYDEKYHERRLAIIPVGEEFEIIYGEISIALIHSHVELYIYFSDEIGTMYKQFLHGEIHDLRLDPPINAI